MGVGQDCRGVGVLDPVVGRLVPGGIARQEAGLAESAEVGGSACQQLVDVGLVSGIKEDGVPWAVKDSMEGQREFHGAQIRPEVAAGAVHGVDDALAEFIGERDQFFGVEVAEVRGRLQGIKAHD